MFPNHVQFGLHVADVCRSDDNSVFFGQDDNELSVGAVGTESVMSASPHLIAVALQLVTVFGFNFERFAAYAGREQSNVRSAGFVDPRGRKQLVLFPLSSLQEKLSELGHIFGTDVQSPSAAVDALRTFIPSHRVDAERIEETRAEVIDRFLVCNFLHDGCKYIRGQTVVNEYLARLIEIGKASCRERV